MNSPGYAPVGLALAQTTEDNLVEVGVRTPIEALANVFLHAFFSSIVTYLARKL